jgi:hypothetical protein
MSEMLIEKENSFLKSVRRHLKEFRGKRVTTPLYPIN